MKQRKANRLNGYDYSRDNLYFVTSCVHNMVCCFGTVGTGRDLSNNSNDETGTGHDLSNNSNDETGTGHDLSNNSNDLTGTGHDLSLREPRVILNEYGKIADQQWYWLAEQYPYVILHEFIVMPNHIHGIIEICRDVVGTGRDLSGSDSARTGRDLARNDNDSARTGRDPAGNDNDNAMTGRDLSLRKIKSLSELMGAYKTTVSKKIHQLNYEEFTWQRSFYDHIIRDEKSYEKISTYIINNPNSWEQDKFFNK